MRPEQRGGLSAVVLCCAALTGCADAGTAVNHSDEVAIAAARPQRPAPEPSTPTVAAPLGAGVLQRLPQRLTARLQIEPAHGREPGFSRHALEEASTWDRSNVPGTPPPSILLRTVTDTVYGPVDASGQVVTPIIDRRLAWVVADADAMICAASGGPFDPHPPPNRRAVPLCGEGAFLTLIDARNGQFLFSYQS